jgi:hypothetical protein
MAVNKALPLIHTAPVYPTVYCVGCGVDFVRRNASTDECTMNAGPCSCGAWHYWEHLCKRCEADRRECIPERPSLVESPLEQALRLAPESVRVGGAALEGDEG